MELHHEVRVVGVHMGAPPYMNDPPYRGALPWKNGSSWCSTVEKWVISVHWVLPPWRSGSGKYALGVSLTTCAMA